MFKEELASTGSLWIMGDPFLRAYYSIYDMENLKIGLVGIAQTVRNSID
jgi:hypothetical protein